jgi:hypothetical protein
MIKLAKSQTQNILAYANDVSLMAYGAYAHIYPRHVDPFAASGSMGADCIGIGPVFVSILVVTVLMLYMHELHRKEARLEGKEVGNECECQPSYYLTRFSRSASFVLVVGADEAKTAEKSFVLMSTKRPTSCKSGGMNFNCEHLMILAE